MAQDVTGDDDPVRTYTPEEQSKLTLQLQAITRRVHAGELRGRPLGFDLLREFHEALFGGVRDHAGRMRRKGWGSEFLTFGPNRSVSRDEVERELQAAFASADRELRMVRDQRDDERFELAALTLAARAYAKLVRVHPFEEGNGRTSRLCAGLLLVELGLRPVPIETVKQDYTEALNTYFRSHDLGPLVDLFVALYPVGR
jgi:fido (protein-threonine AMPylation protein)